MIYKIGKVDKRPDNQKASEKEKENAKERVCNYKWSDLNMVSDGITERVTYEQMQKGRQ